MNWLRALFGGKRSQFRFNPQWKEEMVVTGPGGHFTLYFPIGVPTAILPTQDVWPDVAPAWAIDLWPQLKAELEQWCGENNVRFELDPEAAVY